ncbi:MAG TPA: hypothetical protein VFN10_18705 [Thermoanaerobaculia bacterium]|nr:hypothetical protein [Thermoanaerobaculia bacterium]
MIKITCTNCQKPLSLDETKLPPREVSFPCPVCKAKLSVDRRDFETAAAAQESAAPAAGHDAPAAPSSAGPHPATAHDDDHENEFGAKALIVGADSPAIRHAAKLVGFLPVVHADAARAREYYMQEFPALVFIHPAQITPPPLEGLQPIISLMPVDRRKSFFILIADNLRTLDGNAAFLYGVNLVVATKDLGQFPQIYKDAHSFHERLYSSMNAVMRSLQAG